MIKISRVLLAWPTILGLILLASEAIAQVEPATDTSREAEILDQLDIYGNEGQGRSAGQVSSVTQLRDVSPGDWAYEALRSLVERYGCIEGFPDQTYRGNRATTRYEFAAGLNACLNAIERLIANSEAVLREDLATLQRLVQEFEAELAALGARVDNLEGRVAFLEENNFSTTTKLAGEAVFAVSDAFNLDGGDSAQTVLHDRIRLNFVTSFTGEDQLYTRLDASNAGAFTDDLRDRGEDGIGLTDQGAFTFSTLDNDNDIQIGWLAYYFPIGDRIQVYLPAAFPLWVDFVPSVSPFFDDFTGASGAISSLAESNPIYKIGLSAGGGLGLNFELTDTILLSGGYFADTSFDPSSQNGLFNGAYSALGQITWTPNDRFQVALTYVRGYFDEFEADALDEAGDAVFDLGVGTLNARAPFGVGEGVTATTNSYGGAFSFRLSPGISINGWGGYTDANQESGNEVNEGEADIFYYGLGLAFPDLGKEGSVLGLFAGTEPYNTAADDYPALHLEAFYKYQLTDNISITPGVVYIRAPYGESSRDQALLGTIRTTFLF